MGVAAAVQGGGGCEGGLSAFARVRPVSFGRFRRFAGARSAPRGSHVAVWGPCDQQAGRGGGSPRRRFS